MKLTHEARVETILRWQSSDNRICDALRDHRQPNAQSSHEILQEKRFLVVGQPLGDRQSSLQSFDAACLGDFSGHDGGHVRTALSIRIVVVLTIWKVETGSVMRNLPEN